MLDYKTQVINNILGGCIGVISTEQQSRLRDVIYANLYDFDVLPKEDYKELPATICDYNDELLQKFLIAKAVNGLSQNSLELYKYRIRKFLDDLNKKICDVTTDDIRYYLSCVKVRTKCTNTTLSNVRLCLSSFFSWLTLEEYIPKNPMLRIPSIKTDTMKEKPFSVVDTEKIRNACNNDRDRALVEFLLSTGCRVSEVSSINRTDVDFDTKQLEVIGKGNKQRTVYLSDKSILYLKKYLETRKDNNVGLFVSLASPHSTLSKDGVEAALKVVGNRAKVSNVHPHRFRRTMCCNLVNHGMKIQDVSQIMGHCSLSTTEIYYNAVNTNIRNKFNIITS